MSFVIVHPTSDGGSEPLYLQQVGRYEYPRSPANRRQVWTHTLARAKRWATREGAERNAPTIINGRGEESVATVQEVT